MSAREFLYVHHDPCSPMHPLNVIDGQVSQFPAVDKILNLPLIAQQVSLGHVMEQMYPQLKNKYKFTESTARYLLLTEADAYTPWHVDYTGTSVRYEIISGRKLFEYILPTENNTRLFEEYERLTDEEQELVKQIMFVGN